MPPNPVEQGLAAGAQGAARARGQHGCIYLHLLIEGAEFDGSDGGVEGVEPQGEGHVTEDMLWPKVNAFACICYQLYISYGWVVWETIDR